MDIKKFKNEISTLKTFYELFCKDKHKNQIGYIFKTNFKNNEVSFEFLVCEDCFESIRYSISKLKNCPHEIKPRCRKCPSPCYEKQRWKDIAKVMKYSAIKLSLVKLKTKVIKVFT